MKASHHTRPIRFRLVLICFVILLAGFYALSELYWKPAFIYGEAAGIYWLFPIMDKTLLPLIVIYLVCSVICFVIWLVQLPKQKERANLWGYLSVTLFIFGIILGTAIVSIFAHNTIHMDSVEAKGRVYYLAVYPLFDLNYGLFECDALGFVCENIYLSGDYSGRDWPGTITLSSTSNILYVKAGEAGTIFTYQLP
jgi:hypothetical protein